MWKPRSGYHYTDFLPNLIVCWPAYLVAGSVDPGRDDLPEVRDVLGQLLGVVMRLGLAPRHVPQPQAAIKRGAEQKGGGEVEAEAKPFRLCQYKTLLDGALEGANLTSD